MMRKILSLFLILMLLSVSASPALATAGIEDDCHKFFTDTDMKYYILKHVDAGHKEHWAVIDRTRNDFDPKKECCNHLHNHKQLMPTIAVKDICRVYYKCMDDKGLSWKVIIEEKIGRERGLYYDAETLWNDAIPDPCVSYGHVFFYNLNKISRDDLKKLTDFMTSVDQYLDQTEGRNILEHIAANFLGGSTGIAGTLTAIAKTGGRIPYIGEAILIIAEGSLAVYTMIEFCEETKIIDVLRTRIFDAVTKINEIK